MAKLETLSGGGADLEEPPWARIFPDRVEDDGMGKEWRTTARRYWLKIVAEMRDAETLCTANAPAIMRLAIAYVRYDHALLKMTKAGAISRSPKTKVPMLNLWQTELRAAAADAQSEEMELGISPRRRASVGKVKKRQQKATAFAAYLNKAGHKD